MIPAALVRMVMEAVLALHDTHGAVSGMKPEMLLMQGRAGLVTGTNGFLGFINQDAPPEMRFLHELGTTCSPSRFMRFNSVGQQATLADPTQHSMLGRITGTSLFSGTSDRNRLVVQEFGLPANLPSQAICVAGNSKVNFQKHGRCVRWDGDKFVVNGNPVEKALVPDGGYAEKERLFDLLQFLFQQFPHNHYRVKPDDSASCIGHMTVGRDVTRKDLERLESGTYVVQKAMAQGFKEVSVPFFIDPDSGNGQTIAICGQHIVTRHGQDDFAGNYSLQRQKLAGELRQKILMAARFHIQQQVELGYFGWGSVDFGVNFETGEVCAFEVNDRITATYYPIMASWLMFEGQMRPFDNQSFEFQAGMSFEVMLKRFEGLLLRQGHDTGFVPYCYLEELGFCYGLCVAPDYSALETLTSEVRGRQLALAA